MGPFFSRKILFFSGALGLGLTCLGLEPALALAINFLVHTTTTTTTTIIIIFIIIIELIGFKYKNTKHF